MSMSAESSTRKEIKVKNPILPHQYLELSSGYSQVLRERIMLLRILASAFVFILFDGFWIRLGLLYPFGFGVGSKIGFFFLLSF